MLPDHKQLTEREAAERNRGHEQAQAFGLFLAGCAAWDWFIHFTFRDYRVDVRNGRRVVIPVTDRSLAASGGSGVLHSDPRIAIWKPSSRYQLAPLQPAPGSMLRRVREFLREVEQAAGGRIGFVLAEELGKVSGRWHLHGLVTGVSNLCRKEWHQRAFSRFGRNRIEPPNVQKAAAFYAAKYAAKKLGAIHFCGSLAGVDLDELENRQPRPGRGMDLVISCPELPRELYHMTYPWRKK